MKMKRLLFGFLASLFFCGCAYPQQTQNQMARRGVAGAALGAGAGAAIGALTGPQNIGKGAAAGALLGGLIGAMSGAVSSPSPQQHGGYPGGGYRPDNIEEVCHQYSNSQDREACLEGVSEGEPDRIRNIQSQCRQIGSDRGFYGNDFPQEVAERYEKEAYRDACADGIREGWAQGQKRRAQHIKSRARQAASGYGW